MAGVQRSLHQVAGEFGHGQGHAQLFAGLEAKVQVLAQQFRRERGRHVQGDEGGRLVPGEHRSHDAVVDEIQKIVPADAAFLGEHCDFGEALRVYAEQQVVADLHHSRELALAHVGYPPADRLEVALGNVECLAGPGRDDGELARLDHLAVAADGRSEHVHAHRRRLRTNLRGGFLGDAGAFDQQFGLVFAGEQAVIAENHRDQIVGSGDHAEDDVAIAQPSRGVDHLAAVLDQWLGLAARTVVDRHVAACIQQAFGHGIAHASGADPTDGVLLHVRHNACSNVVFSGVCNRLQRLR